MEQHSIKMRQVSSVGSGEFVKKGKEEIRGYLIEVDSFSQHKDIRLILERLSAFSARASFMMTEAARSTNREVVNFVDNELAIFSKEIDTQFRIWSRYEAVLNREWEMVK